MHPNLRFRWLAIFAVVLFMPGWRSLRAQGKPNFSGVWRVTNAPEFHFVDQHGSNITIRQVISDGFGFRVLTAGGPIDNKEHPQSIDGLPGMFRAGWDGNRLMWETRRIGRIPNEVLHYRRVMELSPDGNKINAQYGRIAEPLSAQALNGRQFWERIGPGPGVDVGASSLTVAPGVKTEQSVAGISLTAFEISLAVGQFVDVSIQRYGVSPHAVLLSPDGEIVVTRETEGRYGSDHLYYIAKAGGLHRLELYTFGRAIQTGRYSVSLQGHSVTTDSDKARLIAEESLAAFKKVAIRDGAISVLGNVLRGFNDLQDLSRQAEIIRTLAKFYAQAPVEPRNTAELLFQSAIRHHQALFDLEGEAGDRRELGLLQRRRKNLVGAIRNFETALSLYRSLGDPDDAISVAANLGAAYSGNGDHQKALDTQLDRLAMARFRAIPSLGTVLREVGLSYLAVHNRDLALTSLEEAVQIHEADHQYVPEISDLSIIAKQVFSDYSDEQSALTYYSRALSIARERHAKGYELDALLDVGETLAKLKRHELAISSFESALALAQETRNPVAVTRSLQGKGLSLEALGRFSEATRCFQSLSEESTIAMWEKLKALGAPATLTDQGKATASSVIKTREEIKEFVLLHILAALVRTHKTEEAAQLALLAYHVPGTAGIVLPKLRTLLADAGECDLAIDFFRTAIGDFSNLSPGARVFGPKPSYRRALYSELEGLYSATFYREKLVSDLLEQERQEAELSNDNQWIASVLVSRIRRNIAWGRLPLASDFAQAFAISDRPAGMIDASIAIGGDLLFNRLPEFQTLGKKILGIGVISALVGEQVKPSLVEPGLQVLRALVPLAERDNTLNQTIRMLANKIADQEDSRCDGDRPKIYSELSSLLLSVGEADESAELSKRMEMEGGKFGWCQLSTGVASELLNAVDVLDPAEALEDAQTLIEKDLKRTRELGGFALGNIEGPWIVSNGGLYKRFSEFLMRPFGRQFEDARVGHAFETNEQGLSNSFVAAIRQITKSRPAGAISPLNETDRTLKTLLQEHSNAVVFGTPNHEFSFKDVGPFTIPIPDELAKKDVDVIPAQLFDVVLYGLHRPTSVDYVQKELLDDRTVLLEYSVGLESSFLWAVTSNGIACFEIPDVTDAAAKFYQMIGMRHGAGQAPLQSSQPFDPTVNEAQLSHAAIALGKTLLGPVASLIKGKRLLIVSDEAIQTIPFAALADPNEPAGTYIPLIVNHEITNLPSASALAAIRQTSSGRPIPTKTLAIIADPVFSQRDSRVKQPNGPISSGGANARSAGLRTSDEISIQRAAAEAGLLDPGETNLARLPFTGREAEALRGFIPLQDQFVATGFEANLGTVMTGPLADYKIVHFATHSMLNDQNADDSGLILSMLDKDGNPQNGFLSRKDIYTLHLPAELVVLSACNTARGTNVPGEGLLGLTRAFFYAGAKRVVATLWPVDDGATAGLMKNFYQGMLTERLSPAAALRAAQIAAWKTKSTHSPYYWAGFVIQGEWR